MLALHVFIVPRRWTSLWRRKLYKACDLRFVIPTGSNLWGQREHEPLTLVIFFSYCRHMPWQIWRVPVLLELAGTVQCLIQENERDAGGMLRKYLQCKAKLDYMPENVVCEMLHSPLGRFFSNTFTHR